MTQISSFRNKKGQQQRNKRIIRDYHKQLYTIKLTTERKLANTWLKTESGSTNRPINSITGCEIESVPKKKKN